MSIAHLRSSTYQWFNHLDAIVNRRIVRGRDHQSNCLAAQGLRAHGSDETGPEDDRVEEFPGVVSLVVVRG